MPHKFEFAGFKAMRSVHKAGWNLQIYVGWSETILLQKDIFQFCFCYLLSLIGKK